jgi:hypothetical protein
MAQAGKSKRKDGAVGSGHIWRYRAGICMLGVKKPPGNIQSG